MQMMLVSDPVGEAPGLDSNPNPNTNSRLTLTLIPVVINGSTYLTLTLLKIMSVHIIL